MARVLVLEDGTERTVELSDTITVVGRSKENKIVLQARQSSRHHCQFEKTPYGYKLVDLESRNGTKVNDKTVNQALLRPGDRVHIGTAVLLFEDPDWKEPPPDVASPLVPQPASEDPTPPALPAVAALLPAPAPTAPPAEPEPRLRRQRSPTTSVDKGVRLAVYERLREQKIITYVGVGAVVFGFLIVGLILLGIFSGESAVVRKSRNDLESARKMRATNPHLALDLLKRIPPDAPHSADAQALARQIQDDLRRQEDAVSGAEQAEFNKIYDLVEANRGNLHVHADRIHREALEFRKKYPSSRYLSSIDEYIRMAREHLQIAFKMHLEQDERSASEALRKNLFGEALRIINAAKERFKTNIEARDRLTKLHREVLEKARSFWQAEDARAKDLKSRGRRDEARKAYGEVVLAMGDGKIEELRDFCTLAQTILEGLR